jgi:NAD(P)-dependent dehydrogenase (short-subunit alcohol dehydrogenase family)
MMQRFAGKTALVIGGNSGIGLAAAQAFSREGARVVVTGRDAATLQSSLRSLGPDAKAYVNDICDLRQIAELFRALRDAFGHIDVLFVSAGILAVIPIGSVSETDWDLVLNTNLKGVFFTVQHALPLLSRGASVILCSSTAAYEGLADASLYATSKAGVLALGRCFAAGLLDRGIRVNVVSPGPTETAIFSRVRGLPSEQQSRLRDEQEKIVPLGRIGTAAEVAAAVLFLASDSASFITGTDLVVDGGCLSCND